MEVQVDSYVENLEGKRRLVNTAHVVMVALDEHDRPIEVPGLIVETEEEKAAWAAGEKRNELRKQRRIENYQVTAGLQFEGNYGEGTEQLHYQEVMYGGMNDKKNSYRRIIIWIMR